MEPTVDQPSSYQWELMHSGDSSAMSIDFNPPKKKRVRARLDHMTPEEKQERRKEKNRQAAQTARDKKKNIMEHLERANKRLLEYNKKESEERRKLAEANRKLQEELEQLKRLLAAQSVIQPTATMDSQQSSSSNQDCKNIPMINVNDSGISDVDSSSKTPSVTGDHPNMDNLAISCSESSDYAFSPDSTVRIINTPTVVSPEPSYEYIDSILGDTDERAFEDKFDQLADYIYGRSTDTSFEPAALISVSPKQMQETSSRSSSVENSVGWTSVQLMLLLLITQAHRLSLATTSCCPRVPRSKSIQTEDERTMIGNLYDYILSTRCIDFRRAAEAIIANKNNIRQQSSIAFRFVGRCLGNNPKYRNIAQRSLRLSGFNE